MHKAEKYLEGIINATTEEQAIEILTEMAKDLGIGQSHGKLMFLKERLELYQKKFKEIRNKIQPDTVYDVKYLQDVRMEAGLCYQEMVDQLSFEVNRLKIAYGEDRKSEIRSTVLTELMNDEEFKKEHNAKSISALKEVYAVRPSYKEWLTCSSISYGLWNDYRSTLQHMQFFIDGIAAQTRTEQTNLRMDLK